MPFYRCMPPAGSGGGGGDVKETVVIRKASSPNLNQMITDLNLRIDNNSNFLQALFTGMSNFNPSSPIVLPSVPNLSCAYMFQQCTNFNQDVVFPEDYNNCYNVNFVGMFSTCSRFNKPINFPRHINTWNGGWNMTNMFLQCTNFNSYINFPDYCDRGAVQLNGFLSGCTNYNQPIRIKNVGKSFNYFLTNCANFNSLCIFDPVHFNPNSDSSLTSFSFAGMYYNCRNFNQPVIFPDLTSARWTQSAINANFMSLLHMCYNWEQPWIYFSAPNHINAQNALWVQNKNKLASINVIFDTPDPAATVWVNQLFAYQTPESYLNWSGVKRLYINNVDKIRSQSNGIYSMFGRNVNVVFTAVTNGYYNATYNTYILNNVADAKTQYSEWINSLNLNYDF